MTGKIIFACLLIFISIAFRYKLIGNGCKLTGDRYIFICSGCNMTGDHYNMTGDGYNVTGDGCNMTGDGYNMTGKIWDLLTGKVILNFQEKVIK